MSTRLPYLDLSSFKNRNYSKREKGIWNLCSAFLHEIAEFSSKKATYAEFRVELEKIGSLLRLWQLPLTNAQGRSRTMPIFHCSCPTSAYGRNNQCNKRTNWRRRRHSNFFWQFWVLLFFLFFIGKPPKLYFPSLVTIPNGVKLKPIFPILGYLQRQFTIGTIPNQNLF